ncbi:hypothetical protein ABTY00_35695 [Streptomyces microflavus]|uniref:hypothetical protein n=1 Tax=Streptomyces microflavus TaxID=1919 RepID=UPI0033281E6C
MFVATEMRLGAADNPLLRLHLRLSGRGGSPAASLAHWAEIWHRQPLSGFDMERLAGELPLMNATVDRLRHDKPLAGLTRKRMRVAVHDADILRLIDAHEKGYVTSLDLAELLADHGPLLVFGVTGRTSMSVRKFSALTRPAHLASVSSRDIEFDLPALDTLCSPQADPRQTQTQSPARTYRMPRGVDVTVLAGGRPVNFYETDSISNLHSDLVYAGMLTGACAVATEAPPTRPGPGLGRRDPGEVRAAPGLLPALRPFGTAVPEGVLMGRWGGFANYRRLRAVSCSPYIGGLLDSRQLLGMAAHYKRQKIPQHAGPEWHSIGVSVGRTSLLRLRANEERCRQNTSEYPLSTHTIANMAKPEGR